MELVNLDYQKIFPFLDQNNFEKVTKESVELYETIKSSYLADKEKVLGWMNINDLANQDLVEKVKNKAAEIRKEADIFILIGVGGSNQGSRAVIKALQKDGQTKVLYSGNNLSANYMNNILAEIEGKSVYLNIIAKNFATLEPGVCFRIFRNYLENNYGQEEAARRIIVTGTPGSDLEELSRERGYSFFPFPVAVGGRYSVMSAVGLLPIAAAGISIDDLLRGASDMQKYISSESAENSDVLKYAVARNMLYAQGNSIEILSYFESLLDYFAKWWIQLFAESEGKDGKGIFPTSCSFTEDLHSLGQYIQAGKRNIFETFINIEKIKASCRVPADESGDGFAYLNKMDFTEMNKIAFESTLKAHYDGKVPCLVLNVPELNAYYLGQLFYFFEIAVYISGKILGINPFDQPGVESYKKNMFAGLGKE